MSVCLKWNKELQMGSNPTEVGGCFGGTNTTVVKIPHSNLPNGVWLAMRH